MGCPGRHSLRDSVQESWSSLEDSLISVADILLARHPKAQLFPTLAPPRYPRDYGYLSDHSSREVAIRCARCSKAAFNSLSAFVTFALVLWLTEFADDCFDAAFSAVADHSTVEVPRVWFDYLQSSVVCDLSPGVRPGGFLHAYSTHWGPWLTNLCRARVNIWLVWGKEDSFQTPAADAGLPECFLPPAEVIQGAKERAAHLDQISMPTIDGYRYAVRKTSPTVYKVLVPFFLPLSCLTPP